MSLVSMFDPSELRGMHDGEPCVLIANGPSLATVPVQNITATTMGINRSWKRLRSHYHYAGDLPHFQEMLRGEWLPEFLFTTQQRWERYVPPGASFYACFLKTLPKREPPEFSFDLTEGVAVHGASTVALQIAVWLGFRPIYYIGLDLRWGSVGHFYDTMNVPNLPNGNMPAKQNAFFLTAAAALRERGVQVINLTEGSACGAFPKKPFWEVFPPPRWE